MRAQNGGRAVSKTFEVTVIMAQEATELQRELIRALLDSGISRVLLVRTVDELCSKRDGANISKDAFGTIKDEVPLEAAPLNSTPKIQERLESPTTHLSGHSVVDQMLRMDAWQAAKMVKIYMQQHNIPQREVVESTGLNQSHLSQHLNKGTPMRSGKRKILYSWFERKQTEILEQYNNLSKRPGTFDIEPGTKRQRRNRFKWGPASAHILYQAYEQQRNPSKEEREALVEACNRAECEQRGVSYSNVEGLGPNLVTESRIYNWFANRRKEETFRMKLAIDAANYPDNPSGGQAPSCHPAVSSQSTLTSPTNHSPTRPGDSPSTAVTSPVTPVNPEFLHPRIGPTRTTTPSSQMPVTQHALPAVGTFDQPPMDASIMSSSPSLQVPPAYHMNGQPPLLVPNTYTVSQPGVLMHAMTNMNTTTPMSMPMPQSFHEGMQQMHGGIPYQVSVGAGPIVHMHPVATTTLPIPPPLQPIVSTIPTPMDLQSRIQDPITVSVSTVSTTVQVLPTVSSNFAVPQTAVESSVQEDSPVKIKVEPYGRIENDEIAVGEMVTVVTQTTNQSEDPSSDICKTQVRDTPVAQCLEIVKSTVQETGDPGQQMDSSGVKSTE